MIPNSRQLAMRDDAIASLLGIVGNRGTNFAGEASFAGDFSADFAGDSADMDGDFSADFSADAPAVAKPTPHQALAAYHAHHASKINRNKRASLLNPNAGSDLKVERYTFNLSQNITLGTAATFTTLNGQPDVSIRPQMVTMNAPTVGFAFIQEIKVANVSVTVGPGQEDAFDYSALSVGRHLDMPLLTPANRASVLGSYSGFVSPGFVGGTIYPFCTSFKGPASLVG